MLFDFEDYINGGVVGTETDCVDCGVWEDMAATARETKDAWFKALNEWYLSATCCLAPNDPCLPAIKKMWEGFLNFYQNYYSDVWLRFWEAHSCDGTFTVDICNEYRKAMIDLKCMVKQLMRLVDGDFIKEGSIPIETIIGCTDNTASNYNPLATQSCNNCCQYIWRYY
jgi:hypothetical protein